MTATVTSLRSPTATKGWRFIATAPAFGRKLRVTSSYDDSLSEKDNHRRAAEAYWRRLGATPANVESVAMADLGNRTFVHVFVRRVR